MAWVEDWASALTGRFSFQDVKACIEISSLILQVPSFPFFLHSSLLNPVYCLSHGAKAVYQLLKENSADPGQKLSENRGLLLAPRDWVWAPWERNQRSPSMWPCLCLCCLQHPAPVSQLDHRPCLKRKRLFKALSSRTKRRKGLFPLIEKITIISGLKFLGNQFGYVVSPLVIKRK